MEVMDWRDGKAIETECERRREAVDVDPSDGCEVLDAVRWAVSVLQEMEAQERTVGEEVGKDEAGEGTSTEAVRKKDAGPSNSRELPTLEGDDDEAEALERKNSELTVESDSETLKHFSSVQEGDAEPRNERRKRKSGVFVLGKSPSGKRARMSAKDKTINNNDVYECLEAAVKEADCGKAGATMAERVQAWLSRPQCLNLTKLIRHCLHKSLNQQPPRKDNVKQSAVWLHQWLVNSLMQITPEEAQGTVLHQSVSVDWLVAHLTNVNPKVFLAVVLDDLVEDVVKCRYKSLTTFSPYVRRVGILEYAALRGPEHIAAVLQSTFPNVRSTDVSTEEEGTSGSQNKFGVRLEATLSVWVVMATLCPQFVGAFVHHWLPLLTVETIRSWTCLFAEIRIEEVLLPPLRSGLVGITPEEPGNIWAWLCVTISRRLSQLATVGADLVLLLSRLTQPSKPDGVALKLSSFATFILEVLYRELSKCLLSRVIGVGQPTSGEPLTAISKEEAQTGALQFADNLKNNMPKLWAEFLNICSESTCPCCQSAPKDSSELDIYKKLAQNGVGHSKAQTVVKSVEIDHAHGVQTDTKIDGTAYSSHSCQGCESNKKMTLLNGRGCEHLDPFVQICHLAILCCGKCTIAELLAETTVMTLSDRGVFERKSFKKLLVVMRVMQMVAGQGRGAEVLEMWAQILVNLLTKANNEQALQKTLAIRLLLDPSFWQRHQRVRRPFNMPVQLANPEQDNEESGLAWKLVWILLRKVLDFQWLQLVPLLHGKDAWDLQLVVLGVLQFLSPDKDSRPQTVVNRLKCVLGIFFQWLDEEVYHMDCLNSTDKRGDAVVGEKWQRVRAMEQLKHVIVQQAALAFSTFTLMVSSLLDYSFEHCARKAGALSLSSVLFVCDYEEGKKVVDRDWSELIDDILVYSREKNIIGYLLKFLWIMSPHSHHYFPLSPSESFSVDSMGMDDVQYKEYLVGYNCDGQNLLLRALFRLKRGLRLQSSTPADNNSDYGGTDIRTGSDYPMPRRGVGVGSRGSLLISTLVAGRLDPYGNFTLLSAPTLTEKNCSTPANGVLLSEENRRNRSGGLSSLDVYERERLGPSHRNSNPVRPLGYSSRDDNGMDKGHESAETTMMELTNVLRRATGSAVSQAAENPGAWSPHPANVLAMLIIDRLETPHETPMTMEQYEEVLPKQVSSPRHIFLMDCFGHNQLLLEMLELVVKHGESHEVLRCVEFIRVLLADNISRWHTAYRTRRSPALPSLKVSEAEKLDRLQVGRLIQLVADTGWLPQPLASTTEIVEVIDGADIADLLLLVWRCMHHAVAFGSKSWGGVSDNPPLPSGALGDSQLQGADDDSGKEGSYTEWEGHLFAILRQNVAQIGAHFAQVYPIRRAF